MTPDSAALTRPVGEPLPSGVTVVVPVYRGAATVGPLVERLTAVLVELALPYEVLLVDDGSPDDSWTVVEGLASKHRHVRGLRMMRNYGQHNALLAGVRQAAYDVVVTMDDDLQHPPEELPRLLAALTHDLDVVYGVPRTLPHSTWRNFFSRATKGSLARSMGVKNIGDISALRVFRTQLRKSFQEYQSPQVLLDVLLSWGTSRFGTVTVQHDARAEGTSNYTFSRLVNQAMLILTGFSTGPLRLASMMGLAFTALGGVLLLYVLGTYFLLGTSLPGFAFLASATAVFSGAQLFALGIMGEYLARIFNRSMDRPPYVIMSASGPASTSGDDSDD